MQEPKYLQILHDKDHKNAEWASKMLPVLIYWISVDKRPHYYSELSYAVGHNTDRIGKVLGIIYDVFVELRKEKGFEDLPSLNGLIVNKNTGLPSEGFFYVYPEYKDLSIEAKRDFADSVNAKALRYKKWDAVLKALKLAPYKPDNSADEQIIRKGTFSKNGSEGPKHKALKEFIYNHPEAVGISNVKEKQMERILLSGDRLDVYFLLKDGTQYAVEIKSEISDDADILRGIFQCVKYESVLNAEQAVHGQHNPVETLLVLGGKMPVNKKDVALALHVDFEDNVKPE